MMPTHNEIKQEAHRLWILNGEKMGDDWRDWFEAELILKNRLRHRREFEPKRRKQD